MDWLIEAQKAAQKQVKLLGDLIIKQPIYVKKLEDLEPLIKTERQKDLFDQAKKILKEWEEGPFLTLDTPNNAILEATKIKDSFKKVFDEIDAELFSG